MLIDLVKRNCRSAIKWKMTCLQLQLMTVIKIQVFILTPRFHNLAAFVAEISVVINDVY